MNLSFYIAKRYIISKKSHNAVNVISYISVFGIMVATAAMVCILSVFNGFTDFAYQSFSKIDPDLTISAVKGKVFDPTTSEFDKIRTLSKIQVISETLEDNALLKFEERQTPAVIRGVSSNYTDLSDVQSIIADGQFALKEGDVEYTVIGAGLAMNLGVRANFISPVEIYAPKRNVKVNLANPNSAFDKAYVYTAGVFLLNQEKYDEQLIFVSLNMARQLFRYENEVSSLDIKLHNPDDVSAVKKEIKSIIGDNYRVKDRFEQQEESFKMVNIEKWVTFLIMSFVLLIAVFNIIGSLSMLIIDKKEDIQILKNLGAKNSLITRIFAFEGWLINMLGCISGLLIGLVACLSQQCFGIIKLGTEQGAFLIDAYPVKVQPFDLLIVFVTVSLIGFIAVLYPVNNMRKTLL